MTKLQRNLLIGLMPIFIIPAIACSQDTLVPDHGSVLAANQIAEFPALAGVSGKTRIYSQGGFGATFQSASNISMVDLCLDYPATSRIGVGIEMGARRGLGYTNSLRTGAVFSYGIPFGKSPVVFRIGGGPGYWSRASEDLMFGHNRPDAELGVAGIGRKWIASLSALHLNGGWVESFPYYFTQPVEFRCLAGLLVAENRSVKIRLIGDAMLAGKSTKASIALAGNIAANWLAELNIAYMSYDIFGTFATANILDPQNGYSGGIRAGFFAGPDIGFIGTFSGNYSLTDDYLYFIAGMIFIAKL